MPKTPKITPKIHVNFLEFFDIYKLRIHKPSQTSPFPIDIPFDISLFPTKFLSIYKPYAKFYILTFYTMSHSFPSYPSFPSQFAKLCNKPFLSATFLYHYHDLLLSYLISPRLILHTIPRQSTPKHGNPQLFSWNFLNQIPGIPSTFFLE
jgi:hypothetical protein